jgi:flagellar hook-associated protein 3 FlgL
VKITNAGPLATAKYQFSTDGGNTWNGTDLALAGGSVNLGDGVTLTFNDAGGTKPFGVNDIFHVNATIGGYYSGNDEDLSAMINRGTSLNYNISGAQVFTAAANNGNGVDVFATLNALKDALNNNDTQGISNQIDNLQKAQSQITMNQSLCGVKQNQIEVTKNSLTNLDTNLDSLLSKTQDADTAKLAVQLSMEQTVLEASYSIANKIGKMTILDFLS